MEKYINKMLAFKVFTFWYRNYSFSALIFLLHITW